MQQNYISEDYVYELLGKDDKSTFEQISFIIKLPDSVIILLDAKNTYMKGQYFIAVYLSD